MYRAHFQKHKLFLHCTESLERGNIEIVGLNMQIEDEHNC